MPYDPSLSTTRDQVRRYVGDVDDDNLMLTDSEIEFFITQESDTKLAAALAAEAIAAEFARTTNYRFSTLWADAGDAYKHFLDLADRLREGVIETAIPSFITSVAVEDDENEPQFTIGMHDAVE